MVSPRQILAVGTDAELLERVGSALRDRGYGFVGTQDAAEGIARFERDGADLVLVCLPLAGFGGGRWLKRIRAADPNARVVVAGLDEEVRSAADALELGALEYLEDALSNLHDLLWAAGVALGSRRGDAQLRYLKHQQALGASWDSISRTSPAMVPAIGIIRRVRDLGVSGKSPTVLLLGESGTGKSLFARSIHYNGVRRSQAFIEVNCASLAPKELHGELFGRERGGSPKARTSVLGLLETADRGTLFLKEVSSLSLDLQGKLLEVIDQRRCQRIGGRAPISLDVQIIASSSSDLSLRVRDGQFREALQQRLQSVTVTLPALRDRGDDAVYLARSFIEETCAQYGLAPRTLAPSAERYLLEYPWPGNVRELKHQLQHLVQSSNQTVLEREDFERSGSDPATTLPAPAQPAPADSGAFSIQVPTGGISLEDVERELIRRALETCSGNVSRAARFLRVSRQTLIYRLRKHRLQSAGTSE